MKTLDLEFGTPVNVNAILRISDIKFEYNGMAGGFHYYIFSDKVTHNKAIELIKNTFGNKIEIDPDWEEWRT